MKRYGVRVLVAALLLALPLWGTQAQMMGGGGHKHQKSASSAQDHAPKADEKAYAAALKNVPNRPYDPWHDVR